jgi:fatty acid desaturase
MKHFANYTQSIYMVHHYLVPYFVLQVPLLRLIALHTVTDLCWSVYLTLIFQASHVNNDVAWPDPTNADSSDWKQSDWAALQIESSLDFAHGDFWTTFMCGSLNYQAVHHLFPHVSQWYYPEMAPIVKQCCEEYGVRYNLKDSIWGMIAAHANRIEIFGGEELVLR